MNRHHGSSPAARVLLALAVVAGAWALAQACVHWWLAADAHQQRAAHARGESAWRWDFAQAAAVVAPGSSGLASTVRRRDGLHAGAGVRTLDLSLGLHGRELPLHALAGARLRLTSAQPLEAMLLVEAREGATAATVGSAAVRPPGGTMEFALAAPLARASVLRLRIHARAPFTLHELTLLTPAALACRSRDPGAACDSSREFAALDAHATPELSLLTRDRLLRLRPQAVATPPGSDGMLAALAARLQASRLVPAVALALGLLVLAWAAWARRVRQPGRPWQLLVVFGVPWALLALGFPRAGEAGIAELALLACCAAALVHPGGAMHWRWIGDARAWRSAATITLVGLLLLGMVVVAGALAGDDPGSRGWHAARLPRYLAWALLQQVLLLVVIAPRTACLSRDPLLAAMLAGAVFALLHLPNFTLMVATFVAGTAWARSAGKHGALLPLALSHWLLGSALVTLAPEWLVRNAEVGGRFLLPGG